MRVLNTCEMKAVYGGDNPGMGPYAPPFTSDMVTQYLTAMGSLLATGAAAGGVLGGLSGLLTGALTGVGAVDLSRAVTDAAHAYNLRNGYDAEGTTYLNSYTVNLTDDAKIEVTRDAAEDVIDCIDNLENGTIEDIINLCTSSLNSDSFYDSSYTSASQGDAYSWGYSDAGNSTEPYYDYETGNGSW